MNLLFNKQDDRLGLNIKFTAAAEHALREDRPLWKRQTATSVRLELHGAYAVLRSQSVLNRTDGLLTPDMLAQVGVEDRHLRALVAIAVPGKGPLLHAYGDQCHSRKCVCGRPWPAFYPWGIHDWPEWNKTAAKYADDVEKQRERRDSKLRLPMFVRDRAHCRYCGRGPLKYALHNTNDDTLKVYVMRLDVAEMDHTHGRAAGPDGIAAVATACGPCNRKKSSEAASEIGWRVIPLDEMSSRFPSFWDWKPTHKYVVNWMTQHPEQVTDWQAQAIDESSSHVIESSATHDFEVITPHDPQHMTHEHDPGQTLDHDPAHDRSSHRREMTPSYGGTGQDRQPPAGQEDRQSKIMRWVLNVLTDQPMACFEVATLIRNGAEPTDAQIKDVERALTRLADLNQAVKIKQPAPAPTTWRLP